MSKRSNSWTKRFPLAPCSTIDSQTFFHTLSQKTLLRANLSIISFVLLYVQEAEKRIYCEKNFLEKHPKVLFSRHCFLAHLNKMERVASDVTMEPECQLKDTFL